MNDLISRSKVIDVLKETGIIVDNDLGHLVVEEIERIPTAFDADAVYRKLWRESEEVCGNTMIETERANEIILEAMSGGVE